MAFFAGGLAERERLREGLLPPPPPRFLLSRRRLFLLVFLFMLLLPLLLLLLLLRLLSLLLLLLLLLLLPWSGRPPDAALIHRVGIRPIQVIHEGWDENFKMNDSAAFKRMDGSRAFKSLTKYLSQHRRSSIKLGSKPSEAMTPSTNSKPSRKSSHASEPSLSLGFGEASAVTIMFPAPSINLLESDLVAAIHSCSIAYGRYWGGQK